MRINKFLPLLIALLIHAVPMIWFYAPMLKSNSQKIAVSNGTNYRQIDLQSFHPIKQTPSVLNRKTEIQKNSQLASTLSSALSQPPTESSASSNSEESVIIKYVEPTYPILARQRGLEGRVKLRAFYNQEGNITNMEIIESSGTKILDEAAKTALGMWKLKSGRSGQLEKTFQFKLNE